MKSIFHVMIFICLFSSFTRAQITNGEHGSARMFASQSALVVGKTTLVAIELTVKNGFHVQSHSPLDKALVPTKLKLFPNDALLVGDVIFPDGEIKDYPLLGKLSVYEGKAVIRFPVTSKVDAKPGPISLNATLSFQACDDQACYPPESLKLELKTEIVPGGTATKEIEPTLFPSATTLIPAPTSAPTNSPTTAPAGMVLPVAN